MYFDDRKAVFIWWDLKLEYYWAFWTKINFLGKNLFGCLEAPTGIHYWYSCQKIAKKGNDGNALLLIQ